MTNKSRNLKGEGSWFEREINGKLYQCYKQKYKEYGIKTFYGSTKMEVKRKKDRFEEEIKYRSNIKKNEENSNMTLRECILMLIFEYKQYSKKSTQKTDESTYKYYISKKEICERYINEISENDMVELMRQYSSEYSCGTINHIYNLYNQTFSMAKKMGIISVNPMEYVKKPTEDNVAKKRRTLYF